MGLGYLLSYGEGAADTPMVFVTIILLTFIGIAAYLMVTWLEGRVLHYIPARTTGAEELDDHGRTKPPIDALVNRGPRNSGIRWRRAGWCTTRRSA